MRRSKGLLVQRLDIGETALERANKLTARWVGKPWRGVIALFVIPLVLGALAAYWAHEHGHPADLQRHIAPTELSGPVQVVIFIGVSVLALLFVLVLVDAVFFAIAPTLQRDEARTRLRALDRAAHSYSIVPAAVRLIDGSEGPRTTLEVTVRNEGRGGQYSVILDAVEGADKPLAHPYMHSMWWGRGGIAEEIPPSESRPIHVGVVKRKAGRLEFLPIMADATIVGDSLLADRTLTAWLRISARNVPEISYTRRVGIVVDWPPDESEPHLALASNPEDYEVTRSSPSFTALLGFDDA